MSNIHSSSATVSLLYPSLKDIFLLFFMFVVRLLYTTAILWSKVGQASRIFNRVWIGPKRSQASHRFRKGTFSRLSCEPWRAQIVKLPVVLAPPHAIAFFLTKCCRLSEFLDFVPPKSERRKANTLRRLICEALEGKKVARWNFGVKRMEADGTIGPDGIQSLILTWNEVMICERVGGWGESC